ncbi:unnamed protein product [Echinostoma caproni]|uniref:MARVEL domain-containing protein n=1 Tax=Echinostoma caproni TaxID=27848 RepID=A0A183B2N2_9TREM|nr:unnamed protein product [Echinostoma caproni]
MTRAVGRGWRSCHFVSGLIILLFGGTILTMQLLFWLRYHEDLLWRWPDKMRLTGIASATVLFIPAVLVLTSLCINSRKLLYSTMIFGAISVLYCLSVGVSNTVEYALGDAHYASVISMGFINLLAGSFMCIYLILRIAKPWFCDLLYGGEQTSPGTNTTTTQSSNILLQPNRVPLDSLDLPQQSSASIGTTSTTMFHSQPAAPMKPPPYQP